MSSMVKRLLIENKDQLYKIIEPNDDLSSNILFIPFLDSMRDHYYGCRCAEVQFNTISNQEYENLKTEEIINFLKDYFKCDSVEFI